MIEREDGVVAVIQAFLDHLEGGAERPSLDHLTDTERREAEMLMASLEASRGIDPHSSRPSLERLLAGTQFEELLHAHGPASADVADVETVRDVLTGVDGRATVVVERGDRDDAVVFSCLDLRVRFLIVDVYPSDPLVTGHVRTAVERIFRTDLDTSRVGVVAGRSDELITQIIAPHDLGRSITAPNGSSQMDWGPVLPLALAVTRMLEECVPEWDAFDFDPVLGDALDVGAIALERARTLIAGEAARPYRGEKGHAYKSLINRESDVADLVASVFTERAGEVDLDAEVTRIAGVSA